MQCTRADSRSSKISCRLSKKNHQALKIIEFLENLRKFILFHLMWKKLDNHSRQMFEEKCAQIEFLSLQNLQEFFNNHCNAMEVSHFDKKTSQNNRFN